MKLSRLVLFFGLTGCQDQAPAPAPATPPPPAVDVPVPVPPPPPPPPPADPRDYLNPVPDGMVDMCTLADDMPCDIAYHGTDNFVGSPLPGYGAPGAWMLREPAQALMRVHKSLAPEGRGLVVFDAYRPIRGTLAMVAWAERSGQEHLLSGYIARRSGHNHGHTVDLSLYELETGDPVDMGCPFDTLDERAHTSNAEGEVLANRMMLVSAMKAGGFRNYSKEWWHYRFPMEGTVPRDVPYGCFEAAEGTWQPEEGWNQPGYQPPMEWVPTPCFTKESSESAPGSEP